MAERPDSLLILRLSALGDVVHTLPALAHLRAALPEAKIGWVVEERCAPLLESHPHLDRVHVVPRRAIAEAAGGWRWGRALKLLRETLAPIRAEGYQLACDFQGNAKSAVVGLCTGATTRLGFAPPDCKEASHLATTRQLDPQPSGQSRIQKYLAMATAVAGPAPPAPPVVPVDGAARARADAWWADGGDRPRCLLAPGSSARMAEKRWPAERFGELGTWWQQTTGGAVAVAWGPNEQALVGRVQARCPGARAAEAAPPLPDLVALIATCDLFVGNDTAAMHLASQLGRDTVALFGPTDPALYAPAGPRARVVRATAPCEVCRRGSPRGAAGHTCLPALPPPRVAEAIESLRTDAA